MAAYASAADRDRLGIRSAALASLPAGTVEAQLEATSRMADGYIGNAYPLPLTAWGDDLRAAIVHVSDWNLLATRGFDPQRGNDEVIRLRYEDAMRWLREIHAGKLLPVGMAGTTTPEASSPLRRSHLFNQRDRGWGRE